MGAFFQDISNSPIKNITITMGMTPTGLHGSMAIPACNPGPSQTLGAGCSSPDVYYYPWLPYGIFATNTSTYSYGEPYPGATPGRLRQRTVTRQ